MWGKILGNWAGGLLNPNVNLGEAEFKDTEKSADYSTAIIAGFGIIALVAFLYILTKNKKA